LCFRCVGNGEISLLTTVLNSSICSFEVVVVVTGQSGRVSRIHWIICVPKADIAAIV
jgi:hypothetical protein